jgi:iron complex transport system substrate-binding protein
MLAIDRTHHRAIPLFRNNLNKIVQRLLLCLALTALHAAATAQQRIITAGSSSSEIICALGLCNRMVATDRTSLFPASLQELPSIGYRNGINAEGILSQRPDLVIIERGYVKEDVIAQLQSAGVKLLIVNTNQHVEATKARIRAIAAGVNKQKEGEELISKIEGQLAWVAKKVNSTSARPKVLCVMARGTGNMMVGGSNSAFGIVPLAGAVNAVPHIDGFKPLNAEALIQANPDYILFFTSGLESIGGLEGALTIPGVAQTTAGKKKQIIHMEGILLTNWGPRVAEAIEQLFYLTHPEAKN